MPLWNLAANSCRYFVEVMSYQRGGLPVRFQSARGTTPLEFVSLAGLTAQQLKRSDAMACFQKYCSFLRDKNVDMKMTIWQNVMRAATIARDNRTEILVCLLREGGGSERQETRNAGCDAQARGRDLMSISVC